LTYLLDFWTANIQSNLNKLKFITVFLLHGKATPKLSQMLD
jgi:hypothetical protein